MSLVPLKIVYCTPSLYLTGGVERVLTLKANYFAEHFGYDITIILTDGKGKPFAYPLSEKIHIVNLDINFDELWSCSFIRKVFVYLKKQRDYRRKLTKELMRIRPDITDTLLRREINFITKIKDGSKKIGELHVNKANYRNFEANESNWFKELFAKFWMHNLIGHLSQLDRFVVLTDEDKASWYEIKNVMVIHNPLSFNVQKISSHNTKRVIAVGRYTYQKGFDLLLRAWQKVEKQCPDWELAIFGDGDKTPYEKMAVDLGLDLRRCFLNSRTDKIREEYAKSSIYVLSSRFEGFGMVLVEAMACGLSVVSFACPCGPRDIIKNGVDGVLVDNGDVEQLTRQLILLMKDETKRQSISDAAILNVQRFQLEQIGEKWKNLFDDVVQDKNKNVLRYS